MIARAHIGYLAFLAISSFLRLHPDLLLYSSVALLSISLHRSLLASLMILLMGTYVTQSPLLLGAVWLIARFFRSALYVKYEKPWEILALMSFLFFTASIVLSASGSIVPGVIAFIFLYHGSFITQKALWSRYQALHNPQSLLLLLGMTLPLVLLQWDHGVFFLMLLSLSCLIGATPMTLDLHILLCCFAWTYLSLQNTPSFFMSLCLWTSSLCIAYKGLYYDFQRIKSTIPRPASRVKHNHRPLSFSEKFSAFRLS